MKDTMPDDEKLLRSLSTEIYEELSNTCQVPPDFEVTFELQRRLREFVDVVRTTEGAPIPMILVCPACGSRHIDEGAWILNRHHTHACQECGMVWRPAVVATVGVKFLPGFKDEVG